MATEIIESGVPDPQDTYIAGLPGTSESDEIYAFRGIREPASEEMLQLIMSQRDTMERRGVPRYDAYYYAPLVASQIQEEELMRRVFEESTGNPVPAYIVGIDHCLMGRTPGGKWQRFASHPLTFRDAIDQLTAFTNMTNQAMVLAMTVGHTTAPELHVTSGLRLSLELPNKLVLDASEVVRFVTRWEQQALESPAGFYLAPETRGKLLQRGSSIQVHEYRLSSDPEMFVLADSEESLQDPSHAVFNIINGFDQSYFNRLVEELNNQLFSGEVI